MRWPLAIPDRMMPNLTRHPTMKGERMSRYRVQGGKLLGMELDTRERPSEQSMQDDRNSPNVLYFHSYLLTRTVIGAIGVLLPLTLMLIEGAFTKHGLRPEDSISAYYHTTAGQDVFVGSLCVVAVMLLTYMSGQAKSADFIVSIIAGIALLGVVFFPTNRGEDLRHADPRLCGPHTLPERVCCVDPTESVSNRWRGLATVRGRMQARGRRGVHGRQGAHPRRCRSGRGAGSAQTRDLPRRSVLSAVASVHASGAAGL